MRGGEREEACDSGEKESKKKHEMRSEERSAVMVFWNFIKEV